MARFSLSIRRIGVTLGVAVVVVVANPKWATAIGIDVWNVPTLRQHIAEGTVKARQFEAQDMEVIRRVEMKDRLVTDLIDGRTTLAEVALVFLKMNQNRPGYMTVIRAGYAGQTDEERMARNVLNFVNPRLATLPADKRAEVTARLETELYNFVTAVPTATE